MYIISLSLSLSKIEDRRTTLVHPNVYIISSNVLYIVRTLVHTVCNMMYDSCNYNNACNNDVILYPVAPGTTPAQCINVELVDKFSENLRSS